MLQIYSKAFNLEKYLAQWLPTTVSKYKMRFKISSEGM